MTIEWAKCVVENGRQAKTEEKNFHGSCDHVSIIPVFSGSGQIITPLVVFTRKEAKYRNHGNGTFETPLDFIPEQNYLYMRPITDVDKAIFEDWATNFVDETSFLQRGGKKILLIFDGYGWNNSYKTLSLFKQINIFVAGLPAHKSHVLRPLEI